MKLKRLLSLTNQSRNDLQIRRQLRKLGLSLLLLVAVHTAAMVWLEGLTVWQGIWLTFTTLSTVGYGDLSAQTQAGQLATIVLMYLSAITLLTFVVSDYIDYRIARNQRIRSGYWEWDLENHILIINSPKYNAARFFHRLVLQIREDEDYKNVEVLLLNTDFSEGLPPILQDLKVKHITGSGNNVTDLKRANAETAKHILVLARDEYHADSDSINFDTAHRLKSLNLTHRVLVECVEDDNRPRIVELGVKSILRPIRSYPELLVRAMDAPGSEVVIEDMFTRSDDHPERYSIWLEGERWADVVNAMVQCEVGTPMAYISKNGDIHVHPKGSETVHAQSLIILVKSDDVPTQQDVDSAFNQFFNKAALL